MNNKVLVAFIGGLLVASGITYFAMRQPEPAPAAKTPPAAAAQPPAPATGESAATAEPAPAPPPEEPPRAVRKPATALTPVPSKQHTSAKPSPMVARDSRAVPVPAAAPSAPPVQQETARPAPVTAPVETARAAEPPPPPPSPRQEPPPPPTPNTVTIPGGTTLTVRLAETLSSEKNKPGDTFTATLDQPLVVDGFVIAERGSRAQGRVVESDRAGKIRGVALMQVELTQISTSDGQKVRVNTAFVEKKGESSKKSDAAKVGVGAAIGAAIGAIAGGGKGAGIGAGVGGAAGAGDVLLTRGKPAELPVESRVSFRLTEAVTITEKLR